MAQSMDSRRRSQPLRLLRNVTYPTYQLRAVAGRGKTPPATVLTICVLQTLAWLRNRFRDFEVPEELKWPDPQDHAQVDPQRFVSFRIDHGYKVEVVWLPEEQNWTMQLTEPDLGPDPGSLDAPRAPVPGRLFETNIAFRISGGEVDCGFRTVVSDIEGTTVPCEVFRIAVIKHLARNPQVGLRQTWKLQDEPHSLATVSAIEKLQEWLKDKERMMPAVIVAEAAPEPVAQASGPALGVMPTIDEIKQNLSGHRHPVMPPLRPDAVLRPVLTPPPLPVSDRPSLLAKAADLERPNNGRNGRVKTAGNPTSGDLFSGGQGETALTGPGALPAGAASHEVPEGGRYPAFVPDLAHYKMGYAQVFLLPLVQLPAFRKHTGRTINNGDILVVEPVAFGGEPVRFQHQRVAGQPEAVALELDALLQDYPKNKPMTFGSVMFLAQAKERERSRAIAGVQSKEELLRAFEERSQAADVRHREALDDWEMRYKAREEKVRRLEERIDQLETDKEELRQQQVALEDAFESKLEERDLEIQRLQALLARPAELSGIPEWVRKHLGEGMVFHARAEREILATPPSDVNLPLLCDALEFLATEYRAQLLGLIGPDECLQRCHRKYNRKFDIALLKGTSMEMYAEDYTIRYGGGTRSRPAERMLDQHLRVGDRNGKLLRIYFLFDRERQLVVVGSLPKHLRTVSYK